MDRQLHDLLDAAAGEPPHRVTVEAVRGRAARRRALESIAAATVVVVLAGLGLAVSTRAASPGPASHPPVRAGEPGYYVQQGFRTAPPATTVVRSTATGAVTATVRSPWGHALIGAIAAASHRTLFMICQQTKKKGADFVVTGSRIYRFQITGSGQITGYSLVRGGVLGDLQVRSMAVTPDGSEIAVTTTPGAGTGPNLPAEILVINTMTGARAAWHGDTPVPGKMTFSVGELSLTSDGNELVYLATPRCIRGKCTPTGNGEEVRAVSPAAKGGQLSSSRLLVRQSTLTRLSTGYINDAVISPDGSTVTVVVLDTAFIQVTKKRQRVDSTVSVDQVSATTGKLVRVLYRVHTGSGFSYRFFSSDPSGRYLMLNAGPTSGMVNGWIDHGRLIRLTPAHGDNIFGEVW